MGSTQIVPSGHPQLSSDTMLRLVTVACLLALVAAQVVPEQSEEFECEEDGLYPDPEDCNKFYNCGHGTAWKQECQEGLVFNPNKGQCDFPDNYHCEGKPDPEPETDFEDYGCYKNPIPQKVDLLEKTDARLDNPLHYKRRENAIEKCFAVAKDAGYEHFAVGNKGQCWGSNTESYKYYGKAKDCPAHGKGKYAVINVYAIAANQP